MSAELANYVSGNARAGLRNAGTGTFLNEATVIFGSTPGALTKTFTPESDEEVYFSVLCTNDMVLVGDCTFADIQLEVGNAATEYEPYHDMGGGTVTPTEPLYGLPGAEDTVDVSVDGDVLVTHRTAIVEVDGTNESAVASTMPCAAGAYAYVTSASAALQMEDSPALCCHFAVVSKNAPALQKVAGTMTAGLTSSGVPNIWFFSDQPTVEAFNTWLQQQDSAGTPVTIVYELATPTTETPADVDPIEPQTGEVNVFTDADSLNITLYKTENNKYASVTGSFSQTQNDFASMLTQMSEISIAVVS